MAREGKGREEKEGKGREGKEGKGREEREARKEGRTEGGMRERKQQKQHGMYQRGYFYFSIGPVRFQPL